MKSKTQVSLAPKANSCTAAKVGLYRNGSGYRRKYGMQLFQDKNLHGDLRARQGGRVDDRGTWPPGDLKGLTSVAPVHCAALLRKLRGSHQPRFCCAHHEQGFG